MSLSLGATAGCAELPPTGSVEDLSGLSARYENPTAMIPGELVERVMHETTDNSDLAKQLDGLRVIYVAVTNAANRLAKEGDADEFALQGTVDVVHACPGHGEEPATRVDEGGAIYMTLSVRDSFVQRGAAGSAEGCRFLVKHSDGKARVELDARLTIDLGADTRIGERIDSILMVRLRDLAADIDNRARSLHFAHDKYDFRVSDQRIETLIDMSSFGLSEFGSAVLIASKDGSFALRERRGEWQCDAEDSCELKR
jgi:hypothetical protein